MHALGYDVKIDNAGAMVQPPASFQSLSKVLAQGTRKIGVVWFTYKGWS